MLTDEELIHMSDDDIEKYVANFSRANAKTFNK